MSPSEKRQIIIDVINIFAEGERDLEDILVEFEISYQKFISWLKQFDLGSHYQWAKLERQRIAGSNNKSVMVLQKGDRLVPIIHPDAGDKERAMRALELYTETDFPLVTCALEAGLNQTKFFKLILTDPDLAKKEKEVVALRKMITLKRLDIDKMDALDQTTRAAFERVLSGSSKEQTIQDVQENQVIDSDGKVIGKNRTIKNRVSKGHSGATAAEMRLALSLLKVGDRDIVAPDAALKADELDYDPDELPDLSMMDIFGEEEIQDEEE